MANTEKTVKITKANRYDDIRALLLGNEVSYGTTVDDAIAFIDHELELLARKNAKRNESGEMTDAQRQNEVYKQLILDYLAGCEEGATCSDLIHSVEEFKPFNTSKISSLTNQLVKEGKIKRLKARKGRTPYALA